MKKTTSEKLKPSILVLNVKNETELILEEESCEGEEESDQPVNEDTLRVKSVTTGGTDISSPPGSPQVEVDMKLTTPTLQSLRGLTLIAHFEDPGVSIAF